VVSGVGHVFVTLENATVDRFVAALGSGAAAVAFMGDSVGFDAGGGPQRYGLQFLNQILASPNIPTGAVLPGYTIVKEALLTLRLTHRSSS